MGQTLTHGVYLPDEGERNCYNGLASNWSILDGAVGTIAEHTSQIAGKAPAVHTHVKSDVIDLFNSANTWSALNTYSNGQIRIKSQYQERGVIPSSSVIQYLEFADKNDAQHGIVGLWDYANGASEIQMYITDKFKNSAKDPTGTTETTILSFGFKTDGSKFLTFSGQVDNSVIPKTNNTYDLGSSSYKWKSFNGINPGALSLPNLNYSDPNQWIDISGNITNETGGGNEYDPAVDGWVVIYAENNPTSLRVNVHAPRPSIKKYLASATGVTIDGMMVVSVPAPAGSRVYIYFNKGSGSLGIATFITCLGNV